jgi:glycosyltransferase involved in cell wall biosynthesis
MSQNYEVPYLICNHFSNVWFKRVGLREQVAGAAGVGGVSSRDVPKYLKSIFVNLLDGINAEFFSKAVLPKEEDREEDFIITLPARICEGKGHTDIILAADKLNKIGYIFKIFFAGREDSSSYKVFLQKRIDQLNLGKIINFTDHLNRVQLRDLYAKSSVVVMPTYGEGLGRVLLEAQSMELPVIAYNTGGVPDAVLPGKTGYLVKKGDAEQLADRIETLMKDKEKRIKMGQEGRKLIMEKFSLTRLAERHENWYLRAMRRKENPA